MAAETPPTHKTSTTLPLAWFSLPTDEADAPDRVTADSEQGLQNALQAALKSGKTTVIGVWLVWMRKALPQVAIRAQVGIPDQLLEQLRTGVLDIAVPYVPNCFPGLP